MVKNYSLIFTSVIYWYVNPLLNDTRDRQFNLMTKEDFPLEIIFGKQVFLFLDGFGDNDFYLVFC